MNIEAKYEEFKKEMLKYEDFSEEELKDMFEAEMLVEYGDAMVACGMI